MTHRDDRWETRAVAERIAIHGRGCTQQVAKTGLGSANGAVANRQKSDKVYRRWMRDLLSSEVDKFGLTVAGEPVFGWRDRSIGAPTKDAENQYWLRIVSERPEHTTGDFWTGNTDSNTIVEINKPQVVGWREWDDGPRRLRAELMTHLPGQVCTPTEELRKPVDFPKTWWTELRRGIDRISAVRTDRAAATQQQVTHRLRVFFGDRVDPTVTSWSTAHGDLHWNNLLYPKLAILDWENWGTAPVGYDAATLYCNSLLAPSTAARVHRVFADLLDTPDGKIAQLYAITRMLHRIDSGDYPDLVLPLHHHAKTLIEG